MQSPASQDRSAIGALLHFSGEGSAVGRPEPRSRRYDAGIGRRRLGCATDGLWWWCSQALVAVVVVDAGLGRPAMRGARRERLSAKSHGGLQHQLFHQRFARRRWRLHGLIAGTSGPSPRGDGKRFGNSCCRRCQLIFIVNFVARENCGTAASPERRASMRPACRRTTGSFQLGRSIGRSETRELCWPFFGHAGHRSQAT
mmetsp:Transcript_106621/g.299578  ORF Transcript_106621/g.299578 Transcript_106621/m.299578 type:complete len:200 (+) Transcript_106621:348-947(+)